MAMDARMDGAAKTGGRVRPKVVIVGGGFGGINAAKGLADAPVDVTLVDRRNYYLFQPLLYQVALAVLSPGDIAQPIRSLMRDARNTEVLMDEVTGFDTAAHRVKLKSGTELEYDYLILATGSTHSYFGKDAWAPIAPGVCPFPSSRAPRVQRLVERAGESLQRLQSSSIPAR
jgi:NADH dehydrogenase